MRFIILSALIVFMGCKKIDFSQKTTYTKNQSADTIKTNPVLIDSANSDSIKFIPSVSFEDYKVKINHSKKAKLDLYSHEYGRSYRTRLKNEFARDSANFAGHYSLVTFGCGSPCNASLLIDRHTGKVYDAIVSSTGFDFRADSRMLIVNPPNPSGYYSNVLYAIPKIYIFDEKTKKFKELNPD